MITLMATLVARPGKEKMLAEFCAQLAKKVQAEEGCLMCIPHVYAEEPQQIVFLEKYKDQASLEAHAQTSHMQEASQELRKLIAGAWNTFLLEL